MADHSGAVGNSYTCTPFGGFYEGQCVETVDNPFKFTGQWHDAEIDQYYLRARMYDPAMMRFTGRDLVRGRFEEPVSLHKYLYCANEPINRTDWNGKDWNIPSSLTGMAIGSTLGALGGVFSFASHMMVLEANGISLSSKDEALLFYGYVFGGAIMGGITGGVAGGLGGLEGAIPSIAGNISWDIAQGGILALTTGGGIATGSALGALHANIEQGGGGTLEKGLVSHYFKQSQLSCMIKEWF